MSDRANEMLPAESFRFLGHRIDVVSDSEPMLARLRSTHRRFLLDGEAPREEPSDVLRIVDRIESEEELRIEDSERRYRLVSTGHVWQFSCQNKTSLEIENLGFCAPKTLTQAALLTTIASLAEGHGLFHGGVVSMNGAGLVLAAPSEMGKTTLTLELVRRGCGFLSDEVACLSHETGVLEPFPRQLNLRGASRELLGLELPTGLLPDGSDPDPDEVSVDIEDLLPGSLAGPCPMRYLIFPAGFADEPWLEPVSRTNVLFRLFDHAVARVDDPAAQLFRYVPVLRQVRCFNLVVGRPGPTADLLLQLPSRREG